MCSNPAPASRVLGGFLGKQSRAFNLKWLKQFKGLVYSPSGDDAYFLPCVFVSSTSAPTSKASLLTCGFSNWKDTKTKPNGHFLGSRKATTFEMFLDATNLYETYYFSGEHAPKLPSKSWGAHPGYACTIGAQVSQQFQVPPPQPENPGSAPAISMVIFIIIIAAVNSSSSSSSCSSSSSSSSNISSSKLRYPTIRPSIRPEEAFKKPQLCNHPPSLILARWLKYEEKVEAGDRWSKPHVATTSLHALFEIRKGIAENTTTVVLDMNATHGCMHQVAGTDHISTSREVYGKY